MQPQPVATPEFISEAAVVTSDWIEIGVARKPFGIEGAVRVESFTEDPERFADYSEVWWNQHLLLVSEHCRRAAGNLLIVRFSKIVGRAQAERLKGGVFCIRRNDLPQLSDPEEWYHTDLAGCTVIDQSSGSLFGRVIRVCTFGAGDLLEVQTDASSSSTVFLPFTRELFPSVDVKEGIVQINTMASVFPSLAGQSET